MTSEYGEIRYDEPDMPTDARRVARMLDTYGRCSFSYAAHGTLHRMTAIDAKTLLMGDPYTTLVVGGPFAGPSGVGDPRDNTHTLWIRGGDNKGTSVWMARHQLHVPEYVAEKFFDGNPTDGTALAVLLLLVEVYRGMVYDIVPTVEKWLENTPGERDPPAFMKPDDENGDN